MTDQISEGAHILDTKYKKNIKYHLLSVFGKDMKVCLSSPVLYSEHSDPPTTIAGILLPLEGQLSGEGISKGDCLSVRCPV